MTQITLHPGDNRETLRRMIDQGVRVHSVVTDPPYGLVSVTKRFGKEGAAPAKHGTDGAFARASAGFMGKAWDGTGIERDPEFWRLIHDILLPGGFVFAFSGSRTGHWQACAMEMAGFIMHPMHGWTFGSGFPKAHNAAMSIDKSLGLKGRREGVKAGHQDFEGRDSIASLREGGAHAGDGGFARPWMDDPEKVADYHKAYVPASDEAAQWDGWAYGTQSQKPALEPIYLGQRPYSEKTGAANLLKHGVGAFNIDGCRVGEDEGGRWPANLLHDGTPEVVALFPAQAGAAAPVKGTEPSDVTDSVYGARDRVPGAFHADSGSAARFFNSFAPDANPIFYHPKASKADRAGSKHPTVKPIALMQHLIRHITPPGGIVLDPFAGSGTTAEAARREGFDCILMEAESEYLDFLRQRFDLPAAPRKPLPDDVLELLGYDVKSKECAEDYDLVG